MESSCVIFTISHPNGKVLCSYSKEALAAAWSCTKSQDYLIGIAFTLETDHNVYYATWHRKVARWTTTSHSENADETHEIQLQDCPCKELFTLDTLSIAAFTETTEDLADEVEAFVNVVVQGMPVTDQKMEQI